jgi:hypothetical protein
MASQGADLPRTEFKVVLEAAGCKYHLFGRYTGRETFSIRILNEDYSQRWMRKYSATFINEVTQKAGCTKKISVFWRMLAEAATRMSRTVKLEIMTEAEIQNVSRLRVSSEPGDRIFLLVTQSSECDFFRYPLPVKSVPFTYEEYAEMIRRLRQDNKRLQENLAASDCVSAAMVIEQKLAEFSDIVTLVQNQKDDEIAALRRKVKAIKQKASDGRWHPPPPQLEREKP